MATTVKILGKSIKIEKKIYRASFCFKVTVGREIFYFEGAPSGSEYRWFFGRKKDFTPGKDAPVTDKEQDEILQFIKFLLVFRAYEYTLSTRRNFVLRMEEIQREKGVEGYADFDYRKEVQLCSVDSLFGSQSNLCLACQFVGHVTNEGGNTLLKTEGYLEAIPFFHMTLEATPESMKKRLGRVIDPEVIDGNYGLATLWFVHNILPTYYMLATI